MNWRKEITVVIVTTMMGLAIVTLAFRKMKTEGHTYTRAMEVTAYCPCDICTNGDNITASGHQIVPSGDFFIAAPRDIPFYTKIIVPGYNKGQPTVVLDRGGTITGDSLDVFFYSHQEALEWGRQNLKVTIFK